MHGNVLILAEARDDSLHPVTYELLGKGRELADKLNCGLDCLLLSPKETRLQGADRLYLMLSQAFSQPEEYLYKANISEFIKEHKPSIVLAGATDFGRSYVPRVAAALGAGLTADCTGLSIGDDGRLIQIRPAFSDNILAHITSSSATQMATVRYGEFPMPILGTEAEIIKIPPYTEAYSGTVVIETIQRNLHNLSEADVVVAGGRGIKATEDISLLQELADCLGGQVGFSRALVEAGLADAAYQIGYSGLRVKPSLYIACGISGAAQHIAGMKDSAKIIAINRDPSAPIFNFCDIGYVGDLYQVIPQLIKEIS